MWSSLILAACALAGVEAPAESDLSQAVLERIYREVAPAVCVIAYSYEVTSPSSSDRAKQDAHLPGLLVSADGLVMARGHISTEFVEPFNFRVTVGHGDRAKEYPATLLDKPSSVNVVFLRLESDTALDLPHVRFPESTDLRIGEPVAVLGVLSSAFDYNPTLAVRRIGSILDSPRTTYCLDEPIPPGFIGGPVVNGRGEVVGVIGYDLAANEGGDLYVRSGYPLVYQAELFARYISAPPAESGPGEADAWLGVFTQPLTDDLAEYWGLEPNGGAVVSTIVPGSPAAEAGIQRGDIIVEFGGVPVRPKLDREVSVLTRLIRESGVGRQVPLRILREGRPLELTATLAAQPKRAWQAVEYEDGIFGLTVRELTQDVRILLNLPEDVQGVIVRRVESGSWAALANVRPGSIILDFGDHRVTNIDEFRQAVENVAAEKPQEVTIFARVGPLTGFYRLEPRWSDANP